MPARRVNVSNLLLDQENPRISRAATQDDALQKILEDQGVKLAVLAKSIVEDGLNPMDRMLAIASPDKGKFIVIEGNRRLAALKILSDPSVLQRIEVPANLQRRLANLASEFDPRETTVLDVFQMPDRVAGAAWIRQRHTGENQGAGIVDWNGVASARFRGSDPALQALDLVSKHGSLTREELTDTVVRFPITTLDRLIRTPAVRKLLGIDIAGEKLMTDLPATEVIKPLTRIVRDLSNGTMTVTKLKLRDQQIAYVKGFGADLPDLTKRTGTSVVVEAFTDTDFGKKPLPKPTPAPKPAPKPKAPVRKTLIQDSDVLNVTIPKLAEVEKELRLLSLSTFPHAISVMFRVFLEQSTDHYLTANSIALTVPKKGGGDALKQLRAKIDEAVAHMQANGVPRKNLDGIRKGTTDKNSPLHPDTLHNYVHNAFYSPTERDLVVAWNNAKPFFEKIWA